MDNNRGFPALPDEIYLEIISYLPSVPIPTSTNSPSYPEIRRSRHETLLSLSQTSRSLRRFFWRYLWQRIEVQEGMKVGDEDDSTTQETPYLTSPNKKKALKMYAIELVRQLEIVTIRNPQLAQHVNYLDVTIGECSVKNVLAELARCLSLFSNLHTIQIDVIPFTKRPLAIGNIFERTFKKFSYPQIRNCFVTYSSEPLLVSCPKARRVGYTHQWRPTTNYLHTLINNRGLRLELLEDFAEIFATHMSALVVDRFPNLRTITISPSTRVDHPSHIDILKKLNNLQTITIHWDPLLLLHIPDLWYVPQAEQPALINKLKQDWVNTVKRVLIQIQLGDNLTKTVVIRDSGMEENILIHPTGKALKRKDSA